MIVPIQESFEGIMSLNLLKPLIGYVPLQLE